jgi:hypothetical protein
MYNDYEQITTKLDTLERSREGDIAILSRALAFAIRELQQANERLAALESAA